MPNAYTEDQFVEPAIGLFGEPGRRMVSASEISFGAKGRRGVGIPVARSHATLNRLNPVRPATQPRIWNSRAFQFATCRDPSPIQSNAVMTYRSPCYENYSASDCVSRWNLE